MPQHRADIVRGLQQRVVWPIHCPLCHSIAWRIERIRTVGLPVPDTDDETPSPELTARTTDIARLTCEQCAHTLDFDYYALTEFQSR